MAATGSPPARQRRRQSRSLGLLETQPGEIMGQIAKFLPVASANVLFSVSPALVQAGRSESHVWQPLLAAHFQPSRRSGHGSKHDYRIKHVARRLTEQMLQLCVLSPGSIVFDAFDHHNQQLNHILGLTMECKDHTLTLNITEPARFPTTVAFYPHLLEGPYARSLYPDDLLLENGRFVKALYTMLFEDIVFLSVQGQDPHHLLIRAIHDQSAWLNVIDRPPGFGPFDELPPEVELRHAIDSFSDYQQAMADKGLPKMYWRLQMSALRDERDMVQITDARIQTTNVGIWRRLLELTGDGEPRRPLDMTDMLVLLNEFMESHGGDARSSFSIVYDLQIL